MLNFSISKLFYFDAGSTFKMNGFDFHLLFGLSCLLLQCKGTLCNFVLILYLVNLMNSMNKSNLGVLTRAYTIKTASMYCIFF